MITYSKHTICDCLTQIFVAIWVRTTFSGPQQSQHDCCLPCPPKMGRTLAISRFEAVLTRHRPRPETLSLRFRLVRIPCICIPDIVILQRTGA